MTHSPGLFLGRRPAPRAPARDLRCADAPTSVWGEVSARLSTKSPREPRPVLPPAPTSGRAAPTALDPREHGPPLGAWALQDGLWSLPRGHALSRGDPARPEASRAPQGRLRFRGSGQQRRGLRGTMAGAVPSGQRESSAGPVRLPPGWRAALPPPGPLHGARRLPVGLATPSVSPPPGQSGPLLPHAGQSTCCPFLSKLRLPGSEVTG